MSRENFIHKIEVHVASIILKKYENKFRLLIGRRNKNRSLFPSYWECGGGQVHDGDDFISAIKNQVKDEFGINIEVLNPICAYKIISKDYVIPGIRFICKYEGSESDVKINTDELDEFRWIYESDINNINFIPGLRKDILNSINIFRNIQFL